MLLFGSKDSLALASWCARTEDGVVKIVEFRRIWPAPHFLVQ